MEKNNNLESRLVDEFQTGTPMEFDILNNDPIEDLEESFEDDYEDEYSEESEEEEGQNPIPPSTEEEEEEEVEEFEQEYTQAAILAETYKQEGIFPEDFEIPADLTGHQLQTALFEHTAKRLDENKDAYFAAQGYTPEALEIATLMNQGIHPDIIWEAMQNRNLSGLEIEEGEESTSNRIRLIEAMYLEKGLSEKRIKMLIEDLQDAGEDYEEAKAAKEYFREKERQQIEADKMRVAQEHQAALQAEAERQKTLNKLVDDGDFYGVKLESEKDKTEFLDFMNNKNQIVKIQGQDGKPQVYKLTGYEKKMMELQQDPKKQLAFARLLQLDFNLGEIEQMVATKEQEDLLSRLNAKTTKKVIKRSTGSSIRGNAPKSRPVAEYDINNKNF